VQYAKKKRLLFAAAVAVLGLLATSMLLLRSYEASPWSKYHGVRKGMTAAEVEALFGGPGTPNGPVSEVNWPSDSERWICNRYLIVLRYDAERRRFNANDRVVGKSITHLNAEGTAAPQGSWLADWLDDHLSSWLY
jgi:hypothetical protein